MLYVKYSRLLYVNSYSENVCPKYNILLCTKNKFLQKTPNAIMNNWENHIYEFAPRGPLQVCSVWTNSLSKNRKFTNLFSCRKFLEGHLGHFLMSTFEFIKCDWLTLSGRMHKLVQNNCNSLLTCFPSIKKANHFAFTTLRQYNLEWKDENKLWFKV